MRVKPAIVAAAVAGAALSIVAHPATASASTTAPYIRYGSTGLGVQCVQLALNNAIHAGLQIDGIDGRLTTAAVERFQRAKGLAIDGIVGPDTGAQIWIVDEDIDATVCYGYLPTQF